MAKARIDSTLRRSARKSSLSKTSAAALAQASAVASFIEETPSEIEVYSRLAAAVLEEIREARS